MNNKITTKESLKKVQKALQNKDFKKEFNALFSDYINVKNTDKNAHYYAILKLLENNNFERHEAEDFFKNLRTKNNKLIQQLQEIQQQQQELNKKWREERMNLITNPLNIKSFTSVILITLQEINKSFEELHKQLELRFKNNIVMKEKIKEIQKLLQESTNTLKDLENNEDVLTLNNVVKNIEKIAENTQVLVSSNIIENLNDVDAIEKDNIEKEEEGQEGKKEEAENLQIQESNDKNNDDILIDDTKEESTNLTLDKALENSLHATLNSLDKETDEKTLSFLTLSEYLHSYNNFNLKDVYEKFKNIFSKDEFKSIVIYNEALMNNDVEDVFDLAIEESFEDININEYAKMLRHNFNEYKQLDEEIEEEIDNKKEKELEMQTITRKKKDLDLTI